MKKFLKRLLKTLLYLDETTQTFLGCVLYFFISTIISKHIKIITEVFGSSILGFIVNAFLVAVSLLVIIIVICYIVYLLYELVTDVIASYQLAVEDEELPNTRSCGKRKNYYANKGCMAGNKKFFAAPFSCCIEKIKVGPDTVVRKEDELMSVIDSDKSSLENVKSPCSARILEVLVDEKRFIEAGEPLLVYEEVDVENMVK